MNVKKVVKAQGCALIIHYTLAAHHYRLSIQELLKTRIKTKSALHNVERAFLYSDPQLKGR